jgi:hypothetical protein
MTQLPISPSDALGLERAAGVVVEYEQELYFVPAHVAQRIVSKPVVSRIPGTDLGIALVTCRVT